MKGDGINIECYTLNVSKSVRIVAMTIQELGECIPPPIGKFLAPPNRKSMDQSRSLMIFLYPEVNEAESRKGSKLYRNPYC